MLISPQLADGVEQTVRTVAAEPRERLSLQAIAEDSIDIDPIKFY